MTETPQADVGPPAPAPIDWVHPVASIPEHGLRTHKLAAPETCDAVRAALDILGCSRIEARYRIRSAGAGCYRATGELQVDVTQACVISTDPVAQSIVAEFEANFQPAGMGQSEGDELDPLATTENEIIENGELHIGRVLYEEIASRLDPYPRRPGAAFDWKDPQADAPAGESPFAKLAALRDKAGGGPKR